MVSEGRVYNMITATTNEELLQALQNEEVDIQIIGDLVSPEPTYPCKVWYEGGNNYNGAKCYLGTSTSYYCGYEEEI